MIKQLYGKTSINILFEADQYRGTNVLKFVSQDSMSITYSILLLANNELKVELYNIYCNTNAYELSCKPGEEFLRFCEFSEKWVKENSEIINEYILNATKLQLYSLMKGFNKEHDKKEYYKQYFNLIKIIEKLKPQGI